MITSAQAYSILGILGDLILTKDGSVCMAYTLTNPEPYSLNEQALDLRHEEFFKALKNMPRYSYYHKQDVFIKANYDPSIHNYSNSFIAISEQNHFKKRPYLKHHAVIAFTLSNLNSLEKAYQSNPFAFSERLEREDLANLEIFIDCVEGAVSIIKNCENTSIKRMDAAELKHYLFEYVNGFQDDSSLLDICFNDQLSIGSQKGCFFSISDETYLPDAFQTLADDKYIDSYSVKLKTAILERLGVYIPYNHVVNQIIYFEGNERLRKDLENRIRIHGQHRNFSGNIKHTHKKLLEFQEEIFQENAILCRMHYNVMLWDEDQEILKKAQDRVKEVLRDKDFKYYCPSYEGLKSIFLGSVIGRESKLDNRLLFTTDLNVPLSLSINYSVYHDDSEGVLFTDRIFHIPRRTDLWQASRKILAARNAMCISGTGGGKSSTILNIIQQFIEQGVKVVVVEFGNSFEQLTKLYPERSAHISYDGSSPLGINPFHLENEDELTPDKLKALTTIVLKYWRAKNIKDDTNQTVSVSKFLRDYYHEVKQGYSFASFYLHVKENFNAILRRQEVSPVYFDLESFLHVCSEFMPGGMYENVSALTNNRESAIRDKNLVVFELTQIKKDPFLVSIIMTALFDTVQNKILSDRGKRGILVFDEYAEAQGMEDEYAGNDIHSTVAFAYQKMRKENGAVYTIVQSPAQLPNNHYTKSIIANTQLLYVLPTKEDVYDQIIEAFHIKNQSHIDLMLSIRNNFSATRPYAEVFIRFEDKYAMVPRLEFSREKFYAFQTDGDTWKKLQAYYQQTGSMPNAILKLMKEKNEKINYAKPDSIDHDDSTVFP